MIQCKSEVNLFGPMCTKKVYQIFLVYYFGAISVVAVISLVSNTNQIIRIFNDKCWEWKRTYFLQHMKKRLQRSNASKFRACLKRHLGTFINWFHPACPDSTVQLLQRRLSSNTLLTRPAVYQLEPDLKKLC